MRRILVALAILLLPVATLAQSLGQAAAQERERREKKAREAKEAPRTYTDDDLKTPEQREKEREEREKARASGGKAAPQKAAPQEAAPSRNDNRSDNPDTAPRGSREGGAIQYEPERPRGTTRDAPAEATSPAAPPPDDNADAAAWRDRARPARGALDAARAREGAIESRIAQLRQELNPMSATYQLDPNHMLQVQADITAAEGDLASARQETRTAQEVWEQLLEEARRAGVRPDL